MKLYPLISRGSLKHLVEENKSLVDYMNQTEKDTIDVVAHLKRLDAEKDDQVRKINLNSFCFKKSHFPILLDRISEIRAQEFEENSRSRKRSIGKSHNYLTLQTLHFD